jgi:hypothetical protein
MIIVVSAVATCFGLLAFIMFAGGVYPDRFWGAFWSICSVALFSVAAWLEYGWSWK